MSYFIISRKELGIALDQLYAFCYRNACYFIVKPATLKVEVYKYTEGEDSLIAEIHVSNVTEMSDIIDGLSKAL